MLVLPHLHMGARNLPPSINLGHAGVDTLREHKLVGIRGLHEIGEVRSLHPLLMHPQITGVHGEIEARSAGTYHDHATAPHHEHRHGKGLLAWMLENDIDVVALAGEIPDVLAELAHIFLPCGIFLSADLGHGTPATKLTAIDHSPGAELHYEVALVVVGNDADGIAAGGGDRLHGHGAETSRGAPHQHVLSRLERVGPMAEQHPISRGKRERVAGRFLPGQMLWPRKELARLNSAELCERAVRRFIAPNALRGRKHRVAAIAFLIIPIILIAVNHHLVADLPAAHPRTRCPDDARSIGTGDVEWILVAVDR